MEYAARIGADAQDTAEVRLEKRLVVSASLLTILAATTWGVFYIITGNSLPGAIPIVYSIISIGMLFVLHRTRRHRFYLAFHVVMGILIPVVQTILLGGFWQSSGVILWSLVSPLGALYFYRLRQALFWCGAYISAVLFLALFQPFLQASHPLSPPIITAIFALNVVLISGIVFLMLRTFIVQKDEAYRLLHQEREKSEGLLLNILPREIAAILKVENRIIADQYQSASILFADLVGFTPLTSQMAPVEMVKLLNQLFSYFDALVEKYDLEKIRTIGDNYMVAAGVPRQRPDHAQVLACMALEMRDFIYKFPPAGGRKIEFRIGINSGPVVAGVIGRRKFVYDLWGDAVNIASRMESQGEAGKIQITQATYALIQDQFHCEPRGPMNIKGRGEMMTWFLIEELASIHRPQQRSR